MGSLRNEKFGTALMLEPVSMEARNVALLVAEGILVWLLSPSL